MRRSGPGTDIAFLGGVINYLLSNDKIHHDYVQATPTSAFLVKDDFKFENGLFSGYDADKRNYDKSTWGYQIGEDGFAIGRPDTAAPALRLPADEEALRALHAGDGVDASAARPRTSS